MGMVNLIYVCPKMGPWTLSHSSWGSSVTPFTSKEARRIHDYHLGIPCMLPDAAGYNVVLIYSYTFITPCASHAAGTCHSSVARLLFGWDHYSLG